MTVTATRMSKKQLVEEAKQQFCTCIILFRPFLCSHCSTMTWKCLISRFMEDVNKRRQNFVSLSELEYSSKEFVSKRSSLYLTKKLSWSYCDTDWKNSNSLFKWRFRGHRRRGIFNSLLAGFISKANETRGFWEVGCSATY